MSSRLASLLPRHLRSTRPRHVPCFVRNRSPCVSQRSITNNTDSFITAPPPPKHDRYQATIKNMDVREGVKVGVAVVDEAEGPKEMAERYLAQARSFGTNIIGATGIKELRGTASESKSYPTLQELNEEALPFCLTLLSQATSTSSSPVHQAILEAIDQKVPLIAAVSSEGAAGEGIDEMTNTLNARSTTRLLGPSPSTTLILPHVSVHLGAPLPSSITIKQGPIGIICTTLESVSSTPVLQVVEKDGRGMSALFVGYGPGTRAWEVVEWMYADERTKVILLELPTSKQEIDLLSSSIHHYVSSRPENQKAKPIVAFSSASSGQKFDGETKGLDERTWKDWEKLGVKIVQAGDVGGALKDVLR